jgi:hypothetical protein
MEDSIPDLQGISDQERRAIDRVFPPMMSHGVHLSAFRASIV